MKSEGFDIPTKIRLLIALINDDGRLKLSSSMDKLTGRLTDYYPNNKTAIKTSLSKAIVSVPLKGEIYSYLLHRLAIPELTNEVFAQVSSLVKESNDPFAYLRVLVFLFNSVNYDLIHIDNLKKFIEQICKDNKVNMIQMIKAAFAYIATEDETVNKKLLPAIELFNSLYKSKEDNIWGMIYKIYKGGEKDCQLLSLKLTDILMNYTNGNDTTMGNVDILPLDNLLLTPMATLDNCILPYDYFYSKSIDTFQHKLLIGDILSGFKESIELCCNYLLNIFSFYNIDSTDQLKASYHQTITESIMNSILFQINPKRDITYLSSLVNELITRVSLFESKIVTNINHIFKSITKLPPISISNLVYFLTFFLNNNSSSSNQILNSKFDSPNDNKVVFLSKMLCDKCCNLITKEKYVSLIQDNQKQYEQLLAEINDLPKISVDLTQNELYVEMTDIFKQKKAFEWKEKTSETLHENELLYTFITCLLSTRSKTLSYLREAIYFYSETIQTMTHNEEKQFILLKGLFDTWEHSSVHLLFILELLFNNHILSHLTAIKYIFSEKLNQSKTHVLNWQLYELIETTISNCELLSVKTKNELSEQQQSLAKSDEDSRQSIIQKIEKYEVTESKLKEENEKIATETLMRYSQLYDVCGKLGGEQLQKFLLGNIDSFLMNHYTRINNFTTEREKVDKLLASFK